jgi:hypothetical protein
MQPPQNKFGIPLEKSRELQTADHQHHGEQQNDRPEIDRANRLLSGNDPEDDHGNRSDDRGTRAIDLEAGKFPQGEDNIAGEKNYAAGKDWCLRQERGRIMRHAAQHIKFRESRKV